MASFISSNNFPPQVHHSFVKDGVKTDLVSTVYSDRVFVHITQLNKFGTIMKSWAEPRSDGGNIYQVSTIFGKRDDPLLHIYARQIVERLSTTTNKPLLLAISLKPDSRDSDTFQDILNELFANNAWSQ